MVNTILRLPVVKNRTGLSRSSIYHQMSEGTFPNSISLSSRSIGWVEAEINDWINGRIQLSRQK